MKNKFKKNKKILRIFRILFSISTSIVIFSQIGFYPSAQSMNTFKQGLASRENPSLSMEGDIPTNQIIVKYAATSMASQNFENPIDIQRFISITGISLQYLRTLTDGAIVIRLSERLSSDELKIITDRISSLPEVEYAEADQVLQHTLTPNDPMYTDQWHYFDPSIGNYGINAPAAWDITSGSASVVVGVLDTGITNHAEFSGRTVPGYDFISDIDTANDGNGRDSDPSDPGDWITSAESSSFFSPFYGCRVTNSSWHGTHTAGTIGATGNNGSGVAGIDWNVKILAVRVLGKCGGTISDIADGMRWAAGLAVSGIPANPNPAKVLNLSLSGSGTCSSTLQNAINSITAAGTSVVVSAGNDGLNANNYQPANCNGVITVAATDRNGNRASYSNYGSTVEISAPGGSTGTNGVLSTLNTGTQGPVADTYAYYQGTSMSAPHVSGVLALLLSLDPTLTPSQLLQIIQDHSTAFPAGSSCTTSLCGSGILNAGLSSQSLTEPQPPAAFNKIDPTDESTSQPTNLILTWEATSPVTAYEYCLSTTSGCMDWIDVGNTTSVNINGLTYLTTYYWQVRAWNGSNGPTDADEGFYWNFTSGVSPDDFIITVQTDNTGSSEDNEFTIPTTGSGYDFNVDCDSDGTFEAITQTGEYTCTYTAAGTYRIRISDNTVLGTGFPQIYFNNGGDKEKLLTIDQWGTGHWISMQNAFYGCSNLTITATDTPDLSNVTDLSGMFFNASSFNQDIGDWDTSSVTQMQYMFEQASSFNQDISAWDTSSVNSMDRMFASTAAFDQSLGRWNVSALTSATDMFTGVTLSTANYDALLKGWDRQVLQPGVSFSGGNSTFCAGEYAHINMTTLDGWVITDGGLDCTGITPIFEDVPFDYMVNYGGINYYMYDHIQALYDGGFTAGCGTGPLIYCPGNTLTRAESAVFILRGMEGTGYTPPPGPTGFVFYNEDWSSPTISWSRDWAEGMYDEGLTAGCNPDPLMFCPSNVLSRVEGAVFGLRLKYGVGYSPPPATGILMDDWSSPTISWGEDWAEKAFVDGLLPACGESGGFPLFCPTDLMTRAWSAYMIVEAKDLLVP